MPSTSNVERLLSLALTLAATYRGLSRDELLSLVPGYGDGPTVSRRRQFVRDLARLSNIGLDIRTEPDPIQPNISRYRIVEGSGDGHSFSPGPEERAVLAAASAMWNTDRGSGIAARVRAKLAAAGIAVNARNGHGTLGASVAFGPLVEAVAEGRSVAFWYRAAPGASPVTRTLEPWDVGVYAGREYVLGYDRDREAERLFRVSRIESVPKDEGPARAERDSMASIAGALARSDDTPDDGDVTVTAEPYKALTLRELSGVDPAESQFTVRGTDAQHVLARALAEPQWVFLSGDSSVADEWRSIRSRIALQHQGPASLTRDAFAHLPEQRRPKLRTVTSSDDELTRLSAEVAYVYSHGSVEFADMAAHFDLTGEQLEKDLHTLYLSADYSTGIDRVIDARWDDGIVTISGADGLATPLTFTPPEASALLLGLEALESIDTEFEREAIVNVRTLLTGMLSADHLREHEVGEESDVEYDHAALSSLVAHACNTETAVRIMYSIPSRHGVSIRDITPIGTLSMFGTVYIEAHCALTDSVREFRADRIVAEWEPGDPAAPDPGDFTTPTLLSQLPREPIIVSVAPSASWIFDAFDATAPRLDPATGRSCALISTEIPHALIAAVFEARGAAEVIHPQSMRDAVCAIAEEQSAPEQE